MGLSARSRGSYPRAPDRHRLHRWRNRRQMWSHHEHPHARRARHRRKYQASKFGKLMRKRAACIKEGVVREKALSEQGDIKDPLQRAVWLRTIIGATDWQDNRNHNQEMKAEQCTCQWCETGEVEDLSIFSGNVQLGMNKVVQAFALSRRKHQARC